MIDRTTIGREGVIVPCRMFQILTGTTYQYGHLGSEDTPEAGYGGTEADGEVADRGGEELRGVDDEGHERGRNSQLTHNPAEQIPVVG